METDETVNAAVNNAQKDHLTWYVMCDKKRRNALEPAYKMLERKGFRVFTPMVRKMVPKGKVKEVIQVPFISDLLFVYSTEEKLAPVLATTPTLHYRFKKGGRYREHVVVRDDDMERFIYAVEHAEIKEFFAIDALPKRLLGSTVIIHGGPLDGYKVTLKKMQGSRKKHIFIDLHELAYAEVELIEFTSLEIYKE